MKKLTQEQLAKILEVDRSTLGSWETNRREPDHTTLQRIADFFGVTVDFLLGRTTIKKFAEDQGMLHYGGTACSQDKPDAALIDLPIYGEVLIVDGRITFRDFLGVLPYCNKDGLLYKNCYWLQVKGDSMYPRFFPGDYVLVRPQTDVASGDVAVVIIDDHPGITKQIQKLTNGLVLHSFNSLYKPLEFFGPDRAKIVIVGKVIDMKAGAL